MTPDTDHAPGPIDTLIADCNVMRKRLKDTPPKTVDDLTSVIRNEVIPMVIASLEQIAEVDEVVLEMGERQESYIHDQLAAQLFQTVALGGEVLVETRKLLPSMDELARKRLSDLLAVFEQSLELTAMGVHAASIVNDEDGDVDPAEVIPDDSDEHADDETPDEEPTPEGPVAEDNPESAES